MLNRARAIQVGIGTALLVAGIAPVRAAVGWSVDTGVSHTDNATLTDVDAPSDTLASVGGSITYDLDRPRVQAALNGRGNYVHYLDNTYDDDFQSFALGNLVFGIVPETFLWTFEDTFGQIAINQFTPVTPENRQNINTFSTGPDYILRLGGQSDVKLTARYGDTQYESSSQIDAQKLQGSVSFERRLSDKTLWALVASESHIKYDAPGDPEYDQPALYGTWQTTGPRQTIAVDVGANRVEADGQSYNSPLVRVNWSRRVAPSWTMDLRLASEYQNTSEQFVNQNLNPNQNANPGTAGVGISVSPAAAYEAGLSFAFERPRTKFTVTGGYSRLDYVVDNGLNENSWYATAGLSRRHTPRLEGFVNYRMEVRNYDENALRHEVRQHGEAGVDFRLGKDIFLTAGYQYNDTDSDSSTNNYTANMFYLMFSYRQGTMTGSRASVQQY